MGTDLTRRAFLQGLGAAAAAAAFAGRLPEAQAEEPARAPVPGRVRFGVQTPPQHTTWEEIERTWIEADGLDLDSAFVFDHFMPIFSDPEGPCFEGWMLLAALAAKTRRIRAGVLVTGNTYRNPALLAKMATTVDHVSRGRLILGMGAGWFEREHEAYDVPFHDVGERARRLVEAVTVVKKLFTEKEASFKGRYYTIEKAPFEPKPLQKPYPPILIGGMGPKVIQPLAAREADIWHFFVRSGDPAEARAVCTRFDEICREVGRDPAAVEKSTSIRSQQLTDQGTTKTRDHVRMLVDAGVRHVILGLSTPFDHDLLKRFAGEIVPAFRG
jgi:F420-dependent oxidoreductase-like protein